MHFVVCENDSQTGMPGAHLPFSPLFNQLLFKNSVCFFVTCTQENIFLQSTIIKSWSLLLLTRAGKVTSRHSQLCIFLRDIYLTHPSIAVLTLLSCPFISFPWPY